MFVSQDGTIIRSTGRSRDFIVSSTSKDTKIPKNPQNSKSLEPNSCKLSGLKTGRAQVTGLLVRPANSHHTAIPISLHLTSDLLEEAHEAIVLKIATIIMMRTKKVHLIFRLCNVKTTAV